jgi:hypothetical protein
MRLLFSKAVVAIVGMVLVGGVAPDVQAGFVFDSANGLYYGLTTSAMDWTSAEAQAVAMGGHLAAITDAGVENFLIDNFLQAPQESAQAFWIGLTSDHGGVFGSYTTWTTGQAVNYTDWNPGEPNDNDNDEHYVGINWHFEQGASPTRGTWNDLPLNGLGTNAGYFGIIQVAQLSSVPEPSSIVLCGLGLCGLAGFKFRRR